MKSQRDEQKSQRAEMELLRREWAENRNRTTTVQQPSAEVKMRLAEVLPSPPEFADSGNDMSTGVLVTHRIRVIL